MIRIWLAVSLLLGTLPALAQEYRHPVVEQVIAAGDRPEGVVFDLVTFGDHSWDWASPMLQSLIDQLQQPYPELEVALISHGFELFDLSERSGNALRPSVRQLQTLADAGLDVYVSANYASTRRYQPEDFLPFVNVTDSGPARVEDYVSLGFVRVELENPDGSD